MPDNEITTFEANITNDIISVSYNRIVDINFKKLWDKLKNLYGNELNTKNFIFEIGIRIIRNSMPCIEVPAEGEKITLWGNEVCISYDDPYKFKIYEDITDKVVD